jgi:hypothetical protein
VLTLSRELEALGLYGYFSEVLPVKTGIGHTLLNFEWDIKILQYPLFSSGKASIG